MFFQSGRRIGGCLLLAAISSLSCLNTSAQELRQNDFLDASSLSVNGDAEVLTSGILRLTPSENWKAGSVFSRRKISAARFSTYFAFRISEPGGGGADGIVFAVQPLSADLGSEGGGIGYQGITSSIAIEFDTWRNGWDADANHAGLLQDGDIGHTRFPAISLSESLEDGEPWHAWVDYDGTTISLRLSRQKSRPEAALLAHEVDIPAILGGITAHIGFTSGTGAARANHDILEWIYLDRFSPEEIGERQDMTAVLSTQRTIDLDIEFEFNSAVLTEKGLDDLAMFEAALSALPGDRPELSIIGHTDAVGSASYNMALSERRAAAVSDGLVTHHGYAARRLRSEGRGEEALKFSEDPEADGNRRVEIRLLGD